MTRCEVADWIGLTRPADSGVRSGSCAGPSSGPPAPSRWNGSSWPSVSLLSRSTSSAASSDTSSQASSSQPTLSSTRHLPSSQTSHRNQPSLLISFSCTPGLATTTQGTRCTQSFLDYISLREAFGLTALSTLFAGFSSPLPVLSSGGFLGPVL